MTREHIVCQSVGPTGVESYRLHLLNRFLYEPVVSL